MLLNQHGYLSSGKTRARSVRRDLSAREIDSRCARIRIVHHAGAPIYYAPELAARDAIAGYTASTPGLAQGSGASTTEERDAASKRRSRRHLRGPLGLITCPINGCPAPAPNVEAGIRRDSLSGRRVPQTLEGPGARGSVVKVGGAKEVIAASGQPRTVHYMTSNLNPHPSTSAVHLKFSFDANHCWLDRRTALAALKKKSDRRLLKSLAAGGRLPSPVDLLHELEAWLSDADHHELKSPHDWTNLLDLILTKVLCPCPQLHLQTFEADFMALMDALQPRPLGPIMTDVHWGHGKDESDHYPDLRLGDLMHYAEPERLQHISVRYPGQGHRIEVELVTDTTAHQIVLHTPQDTTRAELAAHHDENWEGRGPLGVLAHLNQRTDPDVTLLLAVALSESLVSTSLSGESAQRPSIIPAFRADIGTLDEALNRAGLTAMTQDERAVAAKLLPTWKQTLEDLYAVLGECAPASHTKSLAAT